MARKGSYQVMGRVLRVMSDETAEVILSNGHRLLAHAPKKTPGAIKELLPDEEIMLEVTTHDLSKGRVIAHSSRNRK